MGIVAAVPSHRRRLDALAVHDPGARLRVPAHRRPDPRPQVVVEPDPGAVRRPLVEVVPDGAPGAEVPRQQPPLAARSRQVPDAVHHLPERDRGRSPRPGVRRQLGTDQLPLGIGQVGWVALLRRQAGHRGVSSIGDPRRTRKRCAQQRSIPTHF